MAIKQRLLKSIQHAKDLLETCDTAVLPKVVVSLKDVDILLQVGLTSEYRVQYKEIVDGVESALQNADSKELAEVCSLSKELLSVAEKQIAGEARFRREIVFLPYKAEMWDSMESVWQAAETDKDHAIAYVVPIPYFDRNPDGSVKEWHCDAGKFPHYVPIRDYRSVNLEEMHPDVIVIHSPYDDTNIVTSVHSDYYSRNLKSYTDKLVYIPYFVLEEVDPKDGEALGSISHFVLTPGVYNADLTIVQSEDMRKAYVEILTQLSEVKDRSYWEKRILGLGSPKIDKVLSTKRENIKLPESWRRIIEKPDGARKKVIFYNVSLASLLEHEDKLLDKMEWVFNVFRERQDEVALLWRPHPLFVSTLESMKPELLTRYRSMVERYRNEDWGIYDDTPELHRSIAISDAYYGDGSSVVTMFRSVGRPVMVQSVNLDLARYFGKLEVVAMCLISKYQMYLMFANLDALFCYDFNTNKLDFVICIDTGELFSNLNFRKVVCCHNVLCIVPFFYKRGFYLYDIATHNLNFVPLERRNMLTGNVMFMQAVVHCDKIYLIGCDYPAIVEYDINSATCVYYDEYAYVLKKYVDGLSDDAKDKHYYQAVISFGDSLYLPFCCGNVVVEFNVISHHFFFHTIGDLSNRYYLGCISNGYLWLTQIEPGRSIVQYDLLGKSYNEHKIYPNKYKIELAIAKKQDDFRGIFCFYSKVYLFPHFANMVLEIDLLKPIIKKCDWLSSYIQNDMCKSISDAYKWFAVTEQFGDRILVVSTLNKCVYCIDMNSKTVNRYDFKLTKSLWLNIMESNSFKSMIGLDVVELLGTDSIHSLFEKFSAKERSDSIQYGYVVYETLKIGDER